MVSSGDSGRTVVVRKWDDCEGLCRHRGSARQNNEDEEQGSLAGNEEAGGEEAGFEEPGDESPQRSEGGDH
jgi:hypothetical protein